MIVDARDLEDQLSPVPNMRGTMMGLFQPLDLIRIFSEKDPVTYEVKQIERQLPSEQAAQGSIQPLKARELILKPEGERSWKWVKIYTTTDIILKNGDQVRIRRRRYRIMAQKAWDVAGYFYYEAVEAFTEEGVR